MAKWVRPTVETEFHIDSSWWDEKGRNFRVHLLSHLCSECQDKFRDYQEAELIDWVDDDTGEVTRVDGLWHSLRTCCSFKPEYIDEHTPLATAVFRVFLANGNEPLSPVELEDKLHRPAETILRTIGGLRIYHGIKPVIKSKRRRSLHSEAQHADG
jgi:hypothetical protein